MEKIMYRAVKSFLMAVAVVMVSNGSAWANYPPAGPIQQVNQTTAGNQDGQAIDMNSSGKTVITWREPSGSVLCDTSIVYRIYDADGNPTTGELDAGEANFGFGQISPDVAINSSGGYVIVWREGTPTIVIPPCVVEHADGNYMGVFGRLYNSSDVPGPVFQINTTFTGNQQQPAVSMAQTGEFVVVWESVVEAVDPFDFDIYGQRFNSSGAPVGVEFPVNTYTTGRQENTDVAVQDDGSFMVVWESNNQDSSGYGIYGQVFDSSGNPVGGELKINTYITNDQRDPHVATDSSGNFLVVWTSDGQDGSGTGIFGQSVSSTGVLQGSEFQVNQITSSTQNWPDVSASNLGRFIIVWGSSASGTQEIRAREFDELGFAFSDEYALNPDLATVAAGPRVAMRSDGVRVMTTWLGLDANGAGVFTRIYYNGGLIPALSTAGLIALAGILSAVLLWSRRRQAIS